MRLRQHRSSRQGATARGLRLRSTLLLAVATAAIGLVASSASADAPIEGVWSFNGGRVAIKEQAGGNFVGTVVSPTKFAQCTHPVGEDMWTQLAPQGDGSYWGLHQWFFDSEECVRNPLLGPTAWRVLQKSGGRILRVCFSAPGSNSQPTIAADGTTANVTFECVDSARISALPEVTSAQLAKYISLPGSRACVDRRRLRIRLRDPKNDPLAKIAVGLRSGKVHRKARVTRGKGAAVATLNLRGLSKPTFTVTIRLTTVLGRHLSTKRKYRLCASGARGRSHHRRALL